MKHTLVVVFVLCVTLPITAQEYQLVRAFPNVPAFSRPIDLQNAGDGTDRLFVAQQRGLIYQISNNQATSTRKVFLDLVDRVSATGGETGLLGLAFHPQFEQNGYLYVNYTATDGGQLKSFISRFEASGAGHDTVLRSTEKVILSLVQPYENHNGGWISFGADGYLYTSFGDGGSGGDPQNNGQNTNTLLGKILRLDVNSGDPYSVPPSNPFAAGGGRGEIYAYGLRNVWRCSFDPVTNKFWAGDVGQGLYEEVDTIILGGNYGWRVKEGYHCYGAETCDSTGFQSPIWEYRHANSNQSITGGYVYRGNTAPSLRGQYLYADYVSGRIWALTYEGLQLAQNVELFDMSSTVSSFGTDEANELYILAYGEGRIYKIVESASVAGQQHENALNIYPNPGKEQIVVQAELEDAVLSIIDVTGKLLFSKEVEHMTSGISIDIRTIPHGVYTLEVRAADKHYRQKFVVAP